MKRVFHVFANARAAMLHPAPRGERHTQMVQLALSLLGGGVPPSAVGRQLRSMYAIDVGDEEIVKVIRWAMSKVTGRSPAASPRLSRPSQELAPAIPPGERVEKFLGNFRCTEADLWEASPWRPLEDWRVDGLMAMAALYYADDYVNVVVSHTVEEMDGVQKARPSGAGRTLTRDDWMRSIRDHGTPESAAGGWLRMNPVLAEGPLNLRGFADDDVAKFRFVLLESDVLPPEMQLSFIAKLRLPVAMILSSGGKSYHAWLKVDAPNAEEYRRLTKQLFQRLKPFGFDAANSNPSRLSRLPGATRVIGAHDGGAQRLVYLNSDPKNGVSII